MVDKTVYEGGGTRMEGDKRPDEQEIKVNAALKHFGISDEEAKAGFWVSKNTEASRKLLGIESDLRINEKEIKRARILIDYEAGYPLIIKRVITE